MDFADYIKLLKSCVKVAQYATNNQVKLIMYQLYFTYFTFVNRPAAFDNAIQLVEVDLLHRKLYELYSDSFDHVNFLISTEETHR